MLVWRLVISKLATLKDIDTFWTVDDILKGNAVLDMQDTFDEIEHDQIKKDAKRK